MLKKILFLTLPFFIFLFFACDSQEINDVSTSSVGVEYVEIKYRNDPVDIAHSRWEYLDTSRSSFIGGAWYDERESYMIIELSDIKYHYCGMPRSTWEKFKSAESFGSDYNSYIKGNYDCRENPIPNY